MGLILEEDIAAVRDRSDIVQIVEQHIGLKKRGRLFWGLCPFHDEKSPSFKIDPQTQLYHCFGCGSGGNVFTFVMNVEKLDFPEAVEMLAAKAGIQLRREQDSEGGQRAAGERERLRTANDLALRFFQAMLNHESYGAEARQYLASRGYSPDLIETFQLGYAPAQDNAIINALGKRGISEEDLVSAGLARKGNYGRPRDMFRGRVIFPIFDLQGRPVAFGGRIIGDGVPKYLNTPDTPLFHKGSLLYGLAAAKEAIGREGRAIVVEGYTDVIALHTAGITNAVGTLGTALTQDHLRLLRRFCEQVVLLFDGDKAGAAAAERALQIGEDVLSLKVVELPEGMDPADAIEQKGADWLVNRLQDGSALLEYAIERIIRRYPRDDRNKRILAAKEAVKVLTGQSPNGSRTGGIDPSGIVGSECIKILVDKLNIDEAAIRHEIASAFRAQRAGRAGNAGPGKDYERRRRRTMAPPPIAVSGEEAAERELLKVLLLWEGAEGLLAGVVVDDFANDLHRGLAAVLKENGLGKLVTGMIHDLTEPQRRLVSGLMLDSLPADNTEQYAQEVLIKVRSCALGRRISELKTKLERINPLKDGEAHEKLFEQLIELEASRRDLKSRDLLEADK